MWEVKSHSRPLSGICLIKASMSFWFWRSALEDTAVPLDEDGVDMMAMFVFPCQDVVERYLSGDVYYSIHVVSKERSISSKAQIQKTMTYEDGQIKRKSCSNMTIILKDKRRLPYRELSL